MHHHGDKSEDSKAGGGDFELIRKKRGLSYFESNRGRFRECNFSFNTLFFLLATCVHAIVHSQSDTRVFGTPFFIPVLSESELNAADLFRRPNAYI